MNHRRFAPGGWAALLLLAAGLIVGLGMVRGSSSVERFFDLRHSRDVLHTTVDGLRTENGALASEIMRLKQSPSYARKVLRDKYHVTESDENIIFYAE